MENQIVVFELAAEHYGLDIAAVEGIIKLQPVTRMPHTPDFVEGVTNLRGAVVPVIDLRRRFALPKQEATSESRIIVAMMNQTKVGMVVDAVTQVLRVPEEAIDPLPAMATTVHSAFIRGIAKLDGRLIILLDLNKVLSREEFASLEALPARG